MKNKLLLILPALVGLVIFLNLPVRSGPAVPVAAGQPAMEPVGITLLPGTVAVDPAIQRRVMALLAEHAPSRGVFAYAITNVDDHDGYYYVSVAGMPLDAQKVRIAEAVWLGMVQLAQLPNLPGIVTELSPRQQTAEADPAPVNTGRGGAGNILPFRSGTQAQYGVSAVHNCGFSLTGWRAVDFFPAENMVYSSISGDVNYVCRDATQVALRIGDTLYTHLADHNQQVGDHYNQGQAISEMVLGAYSDTCGVADQGAQQYHVHFCWAPTPSGFFNADGYLLNTATGVWTKAPNTTVNPLGYLTADWSNANVVPPGPAAGGNIWDSTITGVNSMVENTAGALPVHVNMSMAKNVLGNLGPAAEIINLVALSHFDMTVPLWVIGIISVLELVRIAYAAWMWVKKAIPIIG